MPKFDSSADCLKYSKEQLKQFCKDAGLAVSGTKDELCKALLKEFPPKKNKKKEVSIDFGLPDFKADSLMKFLLDKIRPAEDLLNKLRV